MRIYILFALALIGMACQSSRDAAPTWERGSGEPFLYQAPDGSVLLSYLTPVNDSTYALRFRRYHPDTQTWDSPRIIATGTNWFVNWADFPSLIETPSGRMIAHWLQRNGSESPYAYEVRLTYSDDGGKTWAPPFRLHDDSSATEHGFVSLLPLNDTDVLAVWLDGRKFATGRSEMTLRSRMLLADGWLTPEEVLDMLTCDCCQTALARWQARPVAFYRDRTPREIRDIAYTYFARTGWASPSYVHEDGWEIAGCPVNGPATDATDETLWISWFTGAQDTARVYVAHTSSFPPRFSSPQRIDLGKPIGRVDLVALPGGAALAAWVELGTSKDEASWFMRRISADGSMDEPVLLARTVASRRSGFPKMVRSGNQLVLAWTAVLPDGTTQIRTEVRSLEL